MSAWWHSTLQSVTHLLCPLTDGGIKRCFRLTSVYCVHSLFYSLFRPNVENREAKIKIGTEVAHVTRDSDTTSKVKKSRSPGLFTQRALNTWGTCSSDRENVLGVGSYCYVASARRRARRWGTHGGKSEGAYRVAMRTACITLCYVIELSRKLAVDLLATPALQAFVERLFSVSGMLIVMGDETEWRNLSKWE